MCGANGRLQPEQQLLHWKAMSSLRRTWRRQFPRVTCSDTLIPWRPLNLYRYLLLLLLLLLFFLTLTIRRCTRREALR